MDTSRSRSRRKRLSAFVPRVRWSIAGAPGELPVCGVITAANFRVEGGPLLHPSGRHPIGPRAGPGDFRRLCIRAQDPGRSRRIRHDSDLLEGRRPRQHEHDSRAQGRTRRPTHAGSRRHRNSVRFLDDQPPRAARYRRDHRSDRIRQLQQRLLRSSQVKNYYFQFDNFRSAF